MATTGIAFPFPSPPIEETIDVGQFVLPSSGISSPTAMAITPASIVGTGAVGRPTLLDALVPPATTGTVTTVAGTVLREASTSARKGVKVDSLNFNYQLNGRGTASFEILDLDGTFTAENGDEVTIYRQFDGTSVRLFGGIVDRVTRFHDGKSSQMLHTQVSCIDYGVLLDRLIAHKYYDAVIIWSVFTMVNDLLLSFASTTNLRFGWGLGSGDALVEGTRIFNYVTLNQGIKQLTDEAGLEFRTDTFGNVIVFDAATGYQAAPYVLDDNVEIVRNPVLEYTDGLRANRIYVRPSRGLPLLRTDRHVADGSQRGFNTDFVISGAKPVISVDGVVTDPALTFEYDAYSVEEHLFSYAPDSYGIYSNPNDAPYTAGTIIEITYLHPIPTLPYAEDAALIASDGLSEIVVEVKDEQNIEKLRLIAEGLLIRYKERPATLRFQTRTPGFEPGMLLTVNWTQPAFPVFTGTMVITAVTAQESGKILWFSVEASNTAWQRDGNAAMVAAENYARSRAPISHAGEPIVIKLAQTQGFDYDGNPGMNIGVVPGRRIVQDSGILENVTWTWGPGTAPLTEDIVVDIFLNDVSIFGASKLVYANTDSGTLMRLNFTSYPFYLAKGDVITAEVLTGVDTNAKDGTIQLNVIR
jgi:hypothetical protein